MAESIGRLKLCGIPRACGILFEPFFRLALVLILGAAAAFGQTVTVPVTVQGTVQDSSGAVLAGAAVKARQGDHVAAEAVTATDGRFTLRLAPGDYSLEIS